MHIAGVRIGLEFGDGQPAKAHDIAETKIAGARRLGYQDQRLQLRQRGALQGAAGAGRNFRRQGLEHRRVVRGLKPIRHNERLAGDLVQRILKLPGAVGRVDIDEDQAEFGRRIHRDDPLDVVRRPDADPIPGLQIELQQTFGKKVRLRIEFAIAQAQALLAGHQRLSIGGFAHRVGQQAAYRQLQQRLFCRSANVTGIVGH